MFIAHVRHTTKTKHLIQPKTGEEFIYDTDIEIVEETYTTNQPSQSELISLLKQYQINLNKRDAPLTVHTFQLLSVSDIGNSTPLSSLRLLGVVELNRKMMAEMKSNIVFKKDQNDGK